MSKSTPLAVRQVWIDAHGNILPDTDTEPSRRYNHRCEACGRYSERGTMRRAGWFLCEDCVDSGWVLRKTIDGKREAAG